MKTTTSTALAALLAATIGLAGLVPVANAQQAAGTTTVQPVDFRHGGPRLEFGRQDGAFGLVDMVCAPDGAERLEIAFVRLSHRLELTDTQKPLFDALKASALTAQTGYADTCAAAVPAKDAADKPDLVARLKSRIALDTARLDALNALLPDLEAFYASLTDEQKASLVPEDGPRRMFREFRQELRDGRDTREDRGVRPGR